MRARAAGAVIAVAYLVCSAAAMANPQSARLPQVAVLVDAQFLELPTTETTVGELLQALNLTLSPLDRTDPPVDTPIADGLVIRVIRVTYREVIEEEALAPRTIVLADLDRPVGFTKILFPGKKGLVQKVWRIWEKDGQETLRGVVREEVVEEPEDVVVLRGTHGLSNRGGNWRRPRVMVATAYEPGPRSCGKWATGYTATGVKAEKGVVAVDERTIPLGSRLYIPCYGFAVAADRGGAIKGNRIDLCFATYDEALRFGRRRVKVYILD